MATWTPAALSSEVRRLAARAWRVVEAQHVVSTLKLVDTLAEQEDLERALEVSKPPVPSECRGLHFLLSTPFRYGAPYPGGSRFRRAGFTPGVFYASQAVATALAETAFHRLLFFAESPGAPWPANASEFTAFAVRVRTDAALDLTAPPLSRDAARWPHPSDYGATQTLADAARKTGVEVLRSQSVRDPNGRNLAVLTCRAFGSREPVARQTWRLHLGPSGARAIGEDARVAFGREAFAADPRIAAIEWDR